jgi:hypothetical protein
MAIFGNTNKVVTENFTPDPLVTCTDSCFESAIYAFNKSLSDIHSGLHIADARMEAMVTEGASNVEALMENVVKDTFGKVVATFKRMLDWLKSFWYQVKTFFQKIWKSGKAFTDRFGKMIEAKPNTGFKHKMYPYDLDAGFELVNRIGVKGESYVKKQVSAVNSGTAKEMNISDEVEKVAEEVTGFKSNEVTKEIIKVFRGKVEEPVEISEFSKGESKTGMIDVINGKADMMKNMDKAFGELEDSLHLTIKTIESKASSYDKLEGDAKKNSLSVIHSAVACIKRAITVASTVVNTSKNMYKEAAGAYEKCLKAFLSFKPEKAGSTFSEVEGESLLESSMRFI